MVGEGGFEPPRWMVHHRILSPVRLPFRHSPAVSGGIAPRCGYCTCAARGCKAEKAWAVRSGIRAGRRGFGWEWRRRRDSNP